MSNLIDFDKLTLADIERLKKVLNIKPETEKEAYRRRESEIGTRPGWMKVIQINMGTNRYFCQTQEEEIEFNKRHAGAKMEKFEIELPISTAREYLDAPENVAEFKKGKQNA